MKMKTKWRLPAVLVAIHLAAVIGLFALIEASPDGEAVMGWYLFHFIDFPISFVTEGIDGVFWKQDILWYNDASLVHQFSVRMGWDHLNVGAALMYFIGGTIQWALVGVGSQALWSRSKKRDPNSRRLSVRPGAHRKPLLN